MTQKEYNKCVDQYADRVFRFVVKNLRDEGHAKDVVQDAFEALWLNHTTVDFMKARAWLFTTAYRLTIDFLRKEKGYLELDKAIDIAVVPPEEYRGTNEVLSQLLPKLPDKQRAVLLLRDYEGYAYKEISEITGLSESQVKVYIYRARTFLKNYLVKLENII